jgi:hypothetical protein
VERCLGRSNQLAYPKDLIGHKEAQKPQNPFVSFVLPCG